jgi:hypothetical protein
MRSTLLRLLAALLLAMTLAAAPAAAQGDSEPDGSPGLGEGPDSSPDPSLPDPEPEEPECEEGTLSILDVTVPEGGGVAIVRVILTSEEGFVCEATVPYSTTPGTATEGADYGPIAGEIEFGGAGVAELEVPIADDGLHEGDESFDVVLGEADGASVDPLQSAGTVTIIDDEFPPVMSVTGADVVEGGVAAFTVVLSAPSATTVSASYTTTDGSAGAGSDYAPASGTVVFPPGTTAQIVTVAVPDDRAAEPVESFSLVLASPQNAAVGTGTAAGTIRDNDGGQGGGAGGGGGGNVPTVPGLPPVPSVGGGAGPAIVIPPAPVQGNGAVTWTVTCPATTTTCNGVIRLRTVRSFATSSKSKSSRAIAVSAQKRKAKRRKQNLGSAPYALKAGQTKRISVKVNNSGRRLVRQRKKVRVRATFKTRDQAGKVSTRRQDFTLREIAFRHSR